MIRSINKTFLKGDIIRVYNQKSLFTFVEYRDYGFTCVLKNNITNKNVLRFSYKDELTLVERP